MKSTTAAVITIIIIALVVTGLLGWGAIVVAPHIPALVLFILIVLLLIWALYETGIRASSMSGTR